MFESGYYPIGAEHDPSAPYNQQKELAMDIEVTKYYSLEKTTKVKTSTYEITYDYIDTEGVDINELYEDQHENILSLLDMLRERLEQELAHITDPNQIRRLEYLIKECKGWTVQAEDITEE